MPCDAARNEGAETRGRTILEPTQDQLIYNILAGVLTVLLVAVGLWALLRRLARAYGTRAERLLGDARTIADLGEDVGGGLFTREIDYLCAQEWASSAEDILFRRSKLGLHVPAGTDVRVDAYLARRLAADEHSTRMTL